MSKLYFLGFAFALMVIELIYFSIARANHILDRPNNRSLHEKPTIRGGGIIFPIAVILFFLLTGQVSLYFVIALVMVALVGLWDDIKGLGRSIRFGVQAISMLIIFYDLNVLAHSWWVILLLLIIATGTINAYNFMDGINGITSGYSLIVLLSLYYLNSVTPFVDADLLMVMMTALVVFSFFNFRTKAVCFAGDVGSLSIGFGIIYLILKLTMLSHNYIFILLLAVYGTDSVLTIIHRLILKENIFKAHRLHLYQVIISSTGMRHLLMTIIYMTAQAIVIGVVISNLDKSLQDQYLIGLVTLVLLSLSYVVIKRRVYKPASHGL